MSSSLLRSTLIAYWYSSGQGRWTLDEGRAHTGGAAAQAHATMPRPGGGLRGSASASKARGRCLCRRLQKAGRRCRAMPCRCERWPATQSVSGAAPLQARTWPTRARRWGPCTAHVSSTCNGGAARALVPRRASRRLRCGADLRSSTWVSGLDSIMRCSETLACMAAQRAQAPRGLDVGRPIMPVPVGAG